MDPTLLPGAREGLDSRKYKVYAMAELYNPDIFSSAVLAANKEEWVADVKSAYMDFMDFATRVKARPESTPTDKEEVQNILGAVSDDYAKFLEDFSAKCLLTPDTTTSSDESSVNGSVIATVQNVEKVRTAQIEVNICKEKIDNGVSMLDAEVRRVSDWSSAASHDIQLGMSSVSSWKKQLQELQNLVWDMKRNTECYNLDTDVMGVYEAKVSKLYAEVHLAIEVIMNEDDTRCLYSLAQSKNAVVDYPKFSGAFGQDYHRFEKEMKAAMVDNRVRKDDQIKVLRKNLSGGALDLVPENMTNVDKGFLALSSLYGSASKVMGHRKKQLLSLGQYPHSDTNKSFSFVKSQVEWLMSSENYLQDIFDIAATSDKLNREAYNPDYFSEILYLFPLDVYTKISCVDGSVQSQFRALFSIIIDKRKELEVTLRYLPEDTDSSVKKRNNFSGRPPEDGGVSDEDEVDRAYWELMYGYEDK